MAKEHHKHHTDEWQISAISYQGKRKGIDHHGQIRPRHRDVAWMQFGEFKQINYYISDMDIDLEIDIDI